MEPIYNFEQKQPPRLDERMLRKEAERRLLRKQTALLRVAGLLTAFMFLLFSAVVLQESVVLAIAGIVMFCASLTGQGVLSIVFFYQHGKTHLGEESVE